MKVCAQISKHPLVDLLAGDLLGAAGLSSYATCQTALLFRSARIKARSVLDKLTVSLKRSENFLRSTALDHDLARHRTSVYTSCIFRVLRHSLHHSPPVLGRYQYRYTMQL